MSTGEQNADNETEGQLLSSSPTALPTNTINTTEQLLQACSDGDLDAMALLLKNGTGPNAKLEYGDGQEKTPLWIATDKNHVHLVRTLLEHGANPNQDNSHALDVAKTVKIMKLLLDHGAKGGQYDAELQLLKTEGYDPCPQHNTVEYDPFHHNIPWYCPLHRAETVSEIQAQLDTGFMHDDCDLQKRPCYRTPLHCTIGHRWKTFLLDTERKVRNLQFFLAMGANLEAVNDEGETPLKHAAFHDGSGRVVQLLIDEGAEIGARCDERKTPLHASAMGDHQTVTQILLNKGADVHATDSDGDSALHFATGSGVAELLLEKGASPDARNKKQQTPLHVRARETNTHEVALMLLNKGANVEVEDEYGRTPMHIASGLKMNVVSSGLECQATRVLEHLLKHGANLRAEDNDGKSPLHHAVEVGNDQQDSALDVVELLLENQADVNVLDHQDESPLHSAASRGCWKIAQELLKHGADPNQAVKLGFPTTLGRTPLHYASMGSGREYFDTAELLLNNGADVDPMDHENAPPLFYAAICCNVNLVRLLLERGACISVAPRTRGETKIDAKEKQGKKRALPEEGGEDHGANKKQKRDEDH